jgi:membrane carboxypeptidase/penicillin-binding protein PbpC
MRKKINLSRLVRSLIQDYLSTGEEEEGGASTITMVKKSFRMIYPTGEEEEDGLLLGVCRASPNSTGEKEDGAFKTAARRLLRIT